VRYRAKSTLTSLERETKVLVFASTSTSLHVVTHDDSVDDPSNAATDHASPVATYSPYQKAWLSAMSIQISHGFKLVEMRVI
jgi:hypothetical protein